MSSLQTKNVSSDQWQLRKKRKHQYIKNPRIGNSVVSCQKKLKFELNQALVHVPFACKYPKDRMKLTRKSADTNFAHFVSTVILLMLKGRELHSRCSDLAEMQTHIRCVYFVVNLNYENDPNYPIYTHKLMR